VLLELAHILAMADNIDMIAALLVAAIIGAVTGWLAGQLFQGTGFGLLGDILVGIFGALIASALLASLGLHGGGGILAAIIAATVGAVILLLIVRLIRQASA
jgi:uncharacterized membrane protein YeaQ/YmgE (transglycosylase-associated protein family)